MAWRRPGFERPNSLAQAALTKSVERGELEFPAEAADPAVREPGDAAPDCRVPRAMVETDHAGRQGLPLHDDDVVVGNGIDLTITEEGGRVSLGDRYFCRSS